MVKRVGMLSLFVSCVALGTTAQAWHARLPDMPMFALQDWNTFTDQFEDPFTFSFQPSHRRDCTRQKERKPDNEKMENVPPKLGSVNYHEGQISQHEEILQHIKHQQQGYKEELQKYQNYLKELSDHKSQVEAEISRVNKLSDKVEGQLKELSNQEYEKTVLLSKEKELLNQAQIRSENENIDYQNDDDEMTRDRDEKKRLILQKERELEMLKQQLHRNHGDEDNHHHRHRHHHGNNQQYHGNEDIHFPSNEHHNEQFHSNEDYDDDMSGKRHFTKTRKSVDPPRQPVIKTILNLSINGYHPDDLSIFTEDGVLFVRGKRQCKCTDGCSKREFEKSFTLPQGVDTKTLKATYDKNGTLKIRGLQTYERINQDDVKVEVSKIGHFEISSEHCPKKEIRNIQKKEKRNIYKFKRPENFGNDEDTVTIEPLNDF